MFPINPLSGALAQRHRFKTVSPPTRPNKPAVTGTCGETPPPAKASRSIPSRTPKG